jgi:hypothetical protein
MRGFMMAICLLASPVLAQEEATVPLDDALTEAETALTALQGAATIRAALQDPVGQKAAIDLALTRLKVPDALRPVLAAHFKALLADPFVIAQFAQSVGETFTSMGVTPSNPDVIARMAGEQLPGWGNDWVMLGVARLDAAQQAQAIALRIRLAKEASPQDCADEMAMPAGLTQPGAAQMRVMATWPVADVQAATALWRAAMVAQLSDAPAVTDALTPEQRSQVYEAASRAIVTAMDAAPDADKLYAAFGYPEQAVPEDICAAHLTMLQAVQGMTGPEAALALRYVTDFGLNG